MCTQWRVPLHASGINLLGSERLQPTLENPENRGSSKTVHLVCFINVGKKKMKKVVKKISKKIAKGQGTYTKAKVERVIKREDVPYERC